MTVTLQMDADNPEILSKIFFDGNLCTDSALRKMFNCSLKKFINPFYDPPLLWKGLINELSKTLNNRDFVLEFKGNAAVFEEIKDLLTKNNRSNFNVEIKFRKLERIAELNGNGELLKLLFFLFLIKADFLPKKYSEVKKLLVRLNLPLPLIDGSFDFDREIFFEENLSLPFYNGEKISNEKIRVVRFCNRSESARRVCLSGTTLFRTVPAKNYLYALRKDKEYISFLPRANLVGNTILRLSGDKLNAFFGGKSQVFSETLLPTSWAHSNILGSFIADFEGRLDEKLCLLSKRELNKIAQKKIVKLGAYGNWYCLFFEDGTVAGMPNLNLKNVIDFHLGRNSIIALNAERLPVLKNGKILANERVLELCGLNEHYIFLTTSGKIKTDSGLELSGDNRAVAVSPKGYFVASERGLALYDFQNELQRLKENVIAEELAVSDKEVVWFSASDGVANSWNGNELILTHA